MDLLANWGLPVLVVGALALLTLGFALLIGKWIDAQSNPVVEKPREKGRRKKEEG